MKPFQIESMMLMNIFQIDAIKKKMVFTKILRENDAVLAMASIYETPAAID